MIEIIAHRGLWDENNHKNSEEAFRKALELGFGIETDLRDFNGGVVISHDIADANSMSLKNFIAICNDYDKTTLALNIKSDGLQQLINKQIDNLQSTFFFDMSVPDSLGYIKNNLAFFTRYSDIELLPPLLEEAEGVWFDCFFSSQFNASSLKGFLDQNKKVMLVSPELHGYTYKDYWSELLCFIKTNANFDGNIGLCTDHPLSAKEFFSDVK